MIGVNVTFEYDGEIDRARVIAVAENARGMFEGMPGLRFKFFTFDEEHHRAMNFYVWDSKDAAESFFCEELRERVTGLYGVPPTIDFVEIAQMVDNSALLARHLRRELLIGLASPSAELSQTRTARVSGLLPSAVGYVLILGACGLIGAVLGAHGGNPRGLRDHRQ